MSRALLLSAACLLGCGGDEPELPFTAVAESQPAALLSVWGSSAEDVWVVGGDARDGAGPIVLHYDGTAWSKLDTQLRNIDLWWVFGFADGPVFMSGANGTILRYQNGTFDTLPTPGTQIVFGMWGAAPNDLWAVGGGFTAGGFIWHFDGTTWTEQPDLPPDIASQRTVFKVHGVAADDVWMTGTMGLALHWNGSALERMDIATDASLLSVAGNAQRFVTVGGNFDGVLFENDGTGWVSALPTGGSRLTGVAVSDDDAYAVGQSGTILRRAGSTWSVEKPRVTNENLHAVWIDPDGGVWSVGGKFDTPVTTAGVLLHKGDPLKGSVP